MGIQKVKIKIQMKSKELKYESVFELEEQRLTVKSDLF